MCRKHLRLALAAVMAVSLVGCSKDEDEEDKGPVYAPHIQAMRECIHRDGKLTRALDTYRFMIGDYPTTKQGLHALLERPSGMKDPSLWDGPYLTDEACLKDYWGNEYKYENPGKTHPSPSYDLWSIGENGTDEKGEGDDILNWNVR